MPELKLSVRPLSPVHVWRGENSILGLDAIPLQGRDLCILDLRKLGLEQAKELLDAFNRRDFAKLGEIALRITSDKCSELYGIEANVLKGVQWGAEIKLCNTYVLPGSSLKGYIRTAVLYDVVVTHPNPGQLFKLIEEGLRKVKGRRELKKVASKLESSVFQAPRPEQAGGFVDAFQSLMVPDPTPEQVSRVKLALTKAVVLDIGARPVHLVAQQLLVAWVDEPLVYNIVIAEAPGNPVIPTYPEYQGVVEKLSMLSRRCREPEEIIKALARFGCDLVRFELERISKTVSTCSGEWCTALRQYLGFLQDLEERYCRGISKCAVARLGFMAGYASKTILLEVRRKAPQLFNRVQSLLSQIYEKPWDDRTVKLGFRQGSWLGMGWCEICLTQ